MAGAALKEVYNEVVRCNRCGFCQPACPTYRATGLETAVARGRNTLCREVIEGRIGMRRELGPPVFECLLCRACTANCFPAVRTDEIVVAARADYLAQLGEPLLLKFIFRELLPNPSRLTRLMRMLGVGKRLGLSGAAKVARVLGLFGKEVEQADEYMPGVPREFLRDRLPRLLGADKPVQPAPRVGYFVGCAVNFALPHVGEATLRYLAERGAAITPLDNVCCGLPAYSCGDLEAARRLAARNVAVLSEAPCDAIVTECASCSSFLRDYPRLFAAAPALAEKANALRERICDFTVFAERQSLTPRRDPASNAPSRPRIATWHDPCHLCRYQSVTTQPRALLRSLPGVEFREMREADWCCGGAGSYSITHYDLSMRVLERKMDNLARTGADLLVTACPSCILQLSHGVRRAKLAVEVKHISELLS